MAEGLLTRIKRQGVILGDGGYLIELEKSWRPNLCDQERISSACNFFHGLSLNLQLSKLRQTSHP